MKIVRNLQATRNVKEQIFIKGMEKFDEKVKAFPEKFAVISDFDFTLTRFNENGHSISTIHLMRVSDKKSLLPKETLEQTEKLFSQYHPFELNFEIDPLERSKLMLEWWTKEYTLFTNAGIKEQDMYNIVEKSEPFLRFGVLEFFKICKRYQIPLHVLSAGIGNFIKIIFEKIGVNVDIRANTLTLNENHEISGFQVPVIHSGNKSSSVSDLDYEAVVVLGDMPSDVAAVPSSAKQKILIGFCNDPDNSKYEDYRKNFDVLILNDGNFTFVNSLLRQLIKPKDHR